MKSIKLKIIFIAISLFILGALALPEFSLSINGKEYTYPGIGFGKIGIGTDYGSLVPSSGLFSENKYYTLIDFASADIPENERRTEAEKIEAIIAQRIKYAKLYDISLRLEVKEGNYYITLEIPKNYNNPEEYAKWLSGNGRIGFFQGFSTDETARIDVYDYDLQGNILFETIVIGEQSYKTFTFNIKEEKASLISSLVSNSETGGMVMGIDATPAFLVQPALSTDNQNYSVTNLRAIPLGSYSSDAVIDFINITRAYFQESEPIETNLVFDIQAENIEPMYNNEGGRAVAFTFIIALALICLWFVQKHGIRKAIFASFAFATFFLIYIDALKFVRANLSYGTLLGIFITIIITTVFVEEFMKSTIENFLAILKKYRYIALAMLVNLIILYKLNFDLGFVYDFIGALTLSSLVLIIVSLSYFKFIKEISLNYSQRKK